MPRKPKIVTSFYTAVADTPDEAERLALLSRDHGKMQRPGRPVRADRFGIAFAIVQCIRPTRVRARESAPYRDVEPGREELAANELIRVFGLRMGGDGQPRPDTLTLDNATRIIEQVRRLMDPVVH